jgi:4-oxalocrotonate tautomerase
MPLVRISLRSGKSPEYRRAIADAVHEALVAVANVPPLDRFQIVSEHGADGLIYDAEYLGIHRSDDIVIVQVTWNVGRSLETKKLLYARMAELVTEKVGLRPEDLFVNLVEVVKENWSFGNGIAQYAT